MGTGTMFRPLPRVAYGGSARCNAAVGLVSLHPLRDLLECLPHATVPSFLHREVAQGDDTHELLVVVHHRDPPHLVLAHERRGIGGRHPWAAGDHVVAADVADLGLEIAVGHGPDHDVAVGDEARDAAVLHHRNRARILVAHDP